jgi:DNA-binding NarL/FixJ family response regulator
MMATPLPTRTCRVLELTATGLSTGEVAERLGMSVEEVRQHLSEAFDRLDASTRLDAVIRAAKEGMIGLPQ